MENLQDIERALPEVLTGFGAAGVAMAAIQDGAAGKMLVAGLKNVTKNETVTTRTSLRRRQLLAT